MFFNNSINLSFKNVEKIIFINSYKIYNESKNKIFQYLNEMRFNFVKNKDDVLKVYIPFTRNFDIEEEIDLIEEIIRLIGFNSFLPIFNKNTKIR